MKALKLCFSIIAAAAVSGCTLFTHHENSPGQKIVHKDPGGLILKRKKEIAELNAQGARVEIKGICASACTMYLGVKNVCVHPDAVLKFHGPYHILGYPLDDTTFQYLSLEMAATYPEPIRKWFMETGRTVWGGDYYDMTGAEAFRLGVPACA